MSTPACVIIAVFAALPLIARAEREDVERVLSSMETAVLAGDIPGYLKHVVPAAGPNADPVFRKEQENWAADLKLHVPEAFDLAIAGGDDKPANFWPDRAEFELVMSWRMPAGGTGAGPSGSGGRDRTVSFAVVFVRSDEGAWLYAGEQWLKFDAEPGPAPRPAPGAPADSGAPKDFIATRAKAVEGLDAVAKRVIEVMPEVRAHVEEGFQLKVMHTQEVKIYADMRHLQASIYLSYADPLGGWNEPGESIKLLARPNTGKDQLRALLAHEFGHVATFEMGPNATNMPWWVVEGVAELSAEKFAVGGRDAKSFVANHFKNGTLAPWDEMADFRNTPDKWMSYVYKQGQHMVGFVSEKFGRDGRNAWLRAMAQGASLDDATKAALGISFEQLDKDWRASLEAAAAAPAADPAKAPAPAPGR